MRHNRPDPEVDLSRTKPASHLQILSLKAKLTRRSVEIPGQTVCEVLARLEDLERRLADEIDRHQATKRTLIETQRNHDHALRTRV